MRLTIETFKGEVQLTVLMIAFVINSAVDQQAAGQMIISKPLGIILLLVTQILSRHWHRVVSWIIRRLLTCPPMAKFLILAKSTQDDWKFTVTHFGPLCGGKTRTFDKGTDIKSSYECLRLSGLWWLLQLNICELSLRIQILNFLRTIIAT
jgi:hypothetical protein